MFIINLLPGYQVISLPDTGSSEGSILGTADIKKSFENLTQAFVNTFFFPLLFILCLLKCSRKTNLLIMHRNTVIPVPHSLDRRASDADYSYKPTSSEHN